MASNAPTASEGRSRERSRKLPPGPGRSREEVAAHQLSRIHRALIDVVAASGYGELRVRDVAARAEVSTRAFYEHFDSKEDCFLGSYDLIVRRSAQRVVAAQAGDRDWRERVGLVFGEMVEQLAADPAAAMLVLVEAHAATDTAAARARKAEARFEDLLWTCFSRPPTGVTMPDLIVEAIVAGVVGVAKQRLIDGKVKNLQREVRGLTDWVIGLVDLPADEWAVLEPQFTSMDATPKSRRTRGRDTGAATAGRADILTATAQLFGEHGYAFLTVPRLCSAASVSRRKFSALFDGVEDCYVAALEEKLAEALVIATHAQATRRTQAGGAYHAISALCDYVTADPFLRRVCRGEGLPRGAGASRANRNAEMVLLELLNETMPSRPSTIAHEASRHASWILFRRYAVMGKDRSPRIAATLSHLVLTPFLGASRSVQAISSERHG